MVRGRLQLALILLGGLWHESAHSKPIAEFLGEARTALAENEKRDARRRLDEAEDAIVESVAVVPATHLARFWYLRGMELQMRRKTKRAMDAWRKALVVNPRFEWDIELMEDKDSRRLFEALRGETRVRPEVDVQAPEKTGQATLWVDGQRVRHSDVVRSGPHLLQIVCPDTKIYSTFSEIPDEKLDWLAMCPDGVDTSVVVADTSASQDEFDDLAPDFDDPPKEVEAQVEVASQEEDAAPEVAQVEAPAAQEETTPESAETSKETPSEAVPETVVAEAKAPAPAGPSVLSRISPRTYAMTAGGGLVLCGVIANFAVVEPVWVQIEDVRENPAEYTRWQADWLTGRFNSYRAISLGLIGSGVVVASAGYFLLDAPVKPMIHARGAGITGRF